MIDMTFSSETHLALSKTKPPVIAASDDTAVSSSNTISEDNEGHTVEITIQQEAKTTQTVKTKQKCK